MAGLFIVGTGATAEHLYIFIKEYDLYDVVGFAVDDTYKTAETFLGLPVYSISELEAVADKSRDFLFVAMLWNRLNGDRRDVFERLHAEGWKFANIISPTARIRGRIGVNCWFHDYAVVQPSAVVCDNVIAMAFSLVGSHALIGPHCFLGAKSTVAGNCRVGEQCFVGINATVFDDRRIGDKCIIGACTFVKRDLPDCSVVRISQDGINIKSYPAELIESKLLFKLNRH